MRVIVVILLIEPFGFEATAYATISAWFAALLLNGVSYAFILKRKLKENKVD